MIWKTKSSQLDLAGRSLVMGILNITADSFSDGGRYLDIDAAVAHGLRLEAEGAEIIDVGGESTRPGSEPVPEEMELARVIPVIERLAARSDCILSVDTYKAAVAEAALAAGAHIVNDITGLRGDPRMPEVARAAGAGVIAMHMQGTPRDMQRAPHYTDVVAEVREFFRQTFDRLLGSGLDPATLSFDPGIGFGKTVDHNLQLLSNLAQLRVENRPLVLGVSRKSFIGKVTGIEDPAERFWPTVALTSFARERGVDVIRVHDVEANVQALRMTEAILGGV